MTPTENRIGYLRVSLLDNCNLNCFYCRPKGMDQPRMIPRPETADFEQAIKLLVSMGINKVRFTGGEPTLFPRLTELIQYTHQLNPDIFIGLTSNGLLLERLAPRLAQAGLRNINISLDTLSPEKFKSITTFDRHDQVLKGIEKAIEHVEQVKLNCVVIEGVNDDETSAMVGFANRLGIDLRFIEYMPTRIQNDSSRGLIRGEMIRESLPYPLEKVKTKPESAAVYYESGQLDIRVGFINPVSEPFCVNCNRLRLASDGTLYGCLFSNSGLNLFELLKSDQTDASEKIKELVSAKEYLGCAAVGQDGYLPSFDHLGG